MEGLKRCILKHKLNGLLFLLLTSKMESHNDYCMMFSTLPNVGLARSVQYGGLTQLVKGHHFETGQ